MQTAMFRVFVLVMPLLGLFGSIKTANAQFFLDVYGGYATTANHTVDAETLFVFGTDEFAERRVSYDPSCPRRLGIQLF